MSRIVKSLVLLLALSVVLAACGGSGSGGSAATAGGSGTAAGTFTKEVAFAAGFDYWGGEDESRIMNLYLADDIHGSGWITSISVRHHLSLASPATCPGMIIRMGHTASDNLVTTFATNVENGRGSFQTVFNGTVSVPAGGTDAYYSIPLSQPFYYNGVDNLVVDFTYLSSCSASAGIVAHNTSYNANVFADGSGSSTALTGDVLTQVTDMKFNFAGGDNIAVSATSGGNYYPFSTLTEGQKVQQLFLSSEINGSGPITGFAFPVNVSPVSERTYTINVRLGHTDLTALTPSFNGNFNVGAPITVANGTTFKVPAGVPVGSYIWVPLPNGSFSYNGTNNLVVEIEVTSATGYTAWQLSTDIAGRRLFAESGEDTGDVDGEHYAIKFRFAGGTMDVITAGGTLSSYPFSATTNNKRQYLYRAAELGTKGAITKVACRLFADSIASSYNNFSVVLGHTTNATLGTTFSTNMTGAQTVYSGTFSVPSGLKRGDWIEIPLSTPFAYDGTSNLVVQMSSLQGAGANYFIAGGPDAVRYLNRHAFASSNTTDTAIVNDYLDNMRLTVQ